MRPIGATVEESTFGKNGEGISGKGASPPSPWMKLTSLWPWSSARAHLAKQNDELVNVALLLEMVGERTGRPLGTAGFVEGLELELGYKLECWE